MLLDRLGPLLTKTLGGRSRNNRPGKPVPRVRLEDISFCAGCGDGHTHDRVQVPCRCGSVVFVRYEDI